MIDRIKMEVAGVSESYVLAVLDDAITKYDEETGVIRGALKNIQISYHPKGGILKFDGSLHKFAHGNNYCRYTYSEVVETLGVFEKIFDIIPLDAYKITGIEIGVNIQMSEAPMKYIKTIKSYGSHDFIPMTPRGVKILGKRCKMSEYEIKFYDKTADYIAEKRIKVEDRDIVPKNILRYEVRFSRKQLINKGFPNPTVANLLKREYVIFCVWLLRSIMQEIVFFDPSADFSKIPHKDDKELDSKVKEFIFVLSDGYDEYLDYLRERFGEGEAKNAGRRRDEFIEKMKPLMLGKYVNELTDKFAKEISTVHNYKRAIRSKKT